MNTQNTITAMHSDHKEWLNKLLFYKDDLKVMQHRLDEIAQKNNGKEVLIYIEHFQNQFKIQHEQIDILHHEISKHENELIDEVNRNPVATDHRSMKNHSEHNENIAQFELIFAELRKELMTFLVKWM